MKTEYSTPPSIGRPSSIVGRPSSRTAFALTLFSGAILPVQVGLNTTLGNHAGGAIFGALAAFLLGLVVVAVLTATGRLGKTGRST